jgi:hypothetical protein
MARPAAGQRTQRARPAAPAVRVMRRAARRRSRNSTRATGAARSRCLERGSASHPAVVLFVLQQLQALVLNFHAGRRTTRAPRSTSRRRAASTSRRSRRRAAPPLRRAPLLPQRLPASAFPRARGADWART